MGETSFNLIAQKLLEQKSLMEDLAKENRELRRQLTDLRAGKGIFIEIGGTSIPLAELISAETPVMSAPQNVSAPQKASTPQEAATSITEKPTSIMPTVAGSEQEAATPSTIEEEEKTDVPTFLEEVMLDEFSSALVNSKAVWSGPPKPEELEEEQKAALRRDLMGSYLLE
ncbi:MAG: hypothetical protein JOZ18_11610 [Chloroflexi bacterium]|nr:hypothetical protein [Chloroflexota bacterium]